MKEWDSREDWTLPTSQSDEAETPSTPPPTSPQEPQKHTTPMTIRRKVNKGELSQEPRQQSLDTEEEIEVKMVEKKAIRRPLRRSRALSQRQEEARQIKKQKKK